MIFQFEEPSQLCKDLYFSNLSLNKSRNRVRLLCLNILCILRLVVRCFQVDNVPHELSENHNTSNNARSVHGATHCRTELSPSPSMRSALSTTLEVTSAITSRQKDRYFEL